MEQILANAPWQMWATFVVIGVTIIFYALDRFTLEIVSVFAIIALLLIFHFAPLPLDDFLTGNRGGGKGLDISVLLSGFANPALFAILGLLIVGQGMFQSGALVEPTEYILRLHEKHPVLMTVMIFLAVMVVSAFLNNTPVVVIFIPIVAAIANERKISASKLMMPLSFISIFGGMTTVIGSSTNLLAIESYYGITGKEIGFFDLTTIGVILALVGIIYLLTAGRYLLPERESSESTNTRQSEGKHFIAQLEITHGHPLVGRGAVSGLFPDLPDITVRMVQRKDRAILPPFDDFTFSTHDVVIVAATRTALTKLIKSNPEILEGMMADFVLEPEDDSSQRSSNLSMVEAIVAPGSRLIGRTIAQIGFHYQTNCIILGVERRSRMIRERMNAIRLDAGDVLLVVGDIKDIQALRAERDVLMLETSMKDIPDPRNARIAILIFAFLILSVTSGVLSITIAAITGAAAMVAAGVLNVRQAARAVDRRIYLLIGAALAMATALERTGGAALIGQALAEASIGFGPVVLISAFFIFCAGITNVLSNNATAVLFMPIAVNTASSVGIDPTILALTVIFGANCSFATPVAYQTNLLVMTPGHYKFSDYMRVGGPLIIVMWIAYTIIAPIYFRAIGLL